MDLQLSGQRAVIIGGSSGIGRAMVGRFLTEGCRVDIVDLNEHDAVEAEAAFHRVDIADADALADCAGSFDRIDHVVLTAAIGSGKFGFPFWNLDPADWRKVIEVNVLGAANCAHAFAPRLIENEGGTMLFLTSVAAQIGSQTDPPYSASKAAVINLMQCAARDLAPHGCRANALSPGNGAHTAQQIGLGRGPGAASRVPTPELRRLGAGKNRPHRPARPLAGTR